MVNAVLTEINKALSNLEETKAIHEKRLGELRGKDRMVLCARKASNGRLYYCGRRKGEKKYRYIGGASTKEVNDIKEARYIKALLPMIDMDIMILKNAKAGLKAIDYSSVNSLLPAVYRDPILMHASSNAEKAQKWKKRMEAIKAASQVYRPEDLKIRTNDGNYVRSKSEAIIYNYLLALGITFVYEMPVKVNGTIYLADFVLLSEIDFESSIIIEHQGLMDNESYRKRFHEKMYGYLRAGYVPGINIFFTFDALDGGFDKSPVEDIIRTRVRPTVLRA